MDETSRAALGSHGVTRREMQVLAALIQRLANAEIAARLCISERTVESHVSSLLRKFGVRNRLDLARVAPQIDVVERDGSALPRRLAIIDDQAVLVGREGELQRLMATWDRATTGTLTVVVVRGEAGIGKSRLVARLAADVNGRGGRVLFGACTERSEQPYEPFVTAIAEALSVDRVAELRTQLGRSTAVLGHLDPVIAHHVGIAAVPPTDADLEGQALQDAIRDLLLSAARHQPTLMVIEDVQWATARSRDALVHVATSCVGVPMMLLITARDEPKHRDDVTGAFFGQLLARTSADTITLRGLDVHEATSLIAAVGGDIDPGRAVRQTNGNPLYLRELARDRGRSLEDLIAARFSRLEISDLEIADASTVLGDQIDAQLLASAFGRPLDDVLDALDRIESDGLLRPGDRPGRYAFTHDLYRSVRYATISAGRKMALHAAVARALEATSEGATIVGELARHACLAGARFDARRAAELALGAGDTASSLTEHDQAATHYRRACDALERAGMTDSSVYLAVKIRLGASLALLEDPAGRSTLRDAAVEAQRRGDVTAIAAAVSGMGYLAGGSYSGGRPDPLITSLSAVALERLAGDEIRQRIELQASLGVHLLVTDDADQGTALVCEAVEMARLLGDPVTLGQALLTWRFCGSPADIEQRLACGHELIELGVLTGLAVFSRVGRQHLWWCYRQLGDLAEMERWYRSAEEHAPADDFEQGTYGPAAAMLAGDLDGAARLTETLGEPAADPNIFVRVFRLMIHGARGHGWRPDELELVLAEIVPADVYQPAVAAAHVEAGNYDDARLLLDAARRGGFPRMHAARAGATPLCNWAKVAATIGDRRAVEELEHLLEPLAGQLVDNGAGVEDSIDRVRAVLRLAVDDTGRATAIVSDAITASRRRPTPIQLGRELVILGAARQRSGADHAEVRRILDEAFEISDRTGARLIEREAARHIATLAQPVSHDPFGLTSRERAVIDHVASGATNAQIAAALRISPATVRKHLEHAFKKLDVSTRTAAVARLTATFPDCTTGPTAM